MKTLGISDTKRCIIALKVVAQGEIVPIAGKLPYDVEIITGVLFSIKSTDPFKGIISLRFSEGISNTLLNQPVTNQITKRKKAKYLPLHEVVSGGMLQGYYRDASSFEANYTVLIYLEYIPRKRENTQCHERRICS